MPRTSRLTQIQNRIAYFEVLAVEIEVVVSRLQELHRENGSLEAEDIVLETAQPRRELAEKGQRWYRGVRALLHQHGSTSVEELDRLYSAQSSLGLDGMFSAMITDRSYEGTGRSRIGRSMQDAFVEFFRRFIKARALLLALEEELLSRELPVLAQLSFAVVSDEFERAEMLIVESKGEEALIRASGIISGVALERHIRTVADARNLTIVKNPPSKKHADVTDVLSTLVKEGVLTAVQRSHLDSLFAVRNNCAHAKESVRSEDVERLIRDARTIAASIT